VLSGIIGVAAKLKEHFEAAALWDLEMADVLGTELNDGGGATVTLLDSFRRDGGYIPVDPLRSTKELATESPENFDLMLEGFFPVVGRQYRLANAAEFLEKINGYVRLYAGNPEAFCAASCVT
jgi:hypothetical protein